MTAEERAARHGDDCPPSCPACLAQDLQAKAEAVREVCAQLLEAEAAGEGRRTQDILAKCARKIRAS